MIIKGRELVSEWPIKVRSSVEKENLKSEIKTAIDLRMDGEREMKKVREDFIDRSINEPTSLKVTTSNLI